MATSYFVSAGANAQLHQLALEVLAPPKLPAQPLEQKHLKQRDLKQKPPEINVDRTRPDLSLNFYTEVYPPSSFYQHGKLSGISIEALHLIWQELGQQAQPIQVIPWARGYRSLQNEANAVLFATSRYQAREHLFQWVGPIFTARYILVANNTLADTSLSDISAGEELAYQHSIAVIRDDITKVLLHKKGAKHLFEAADMKHAESLLANQRVDLLAISESGFNAVLKQAPEKAHQYKVVSLLAEIGDYFAFNKQVPKEIVSQYQKAFDALTPELNQLRIKYGFLKQTSVGK
ncbi:substrate-binding periplasmic protein [Thalassotalea euphylliae]|uniref:substrate-binding periplasmic protein n=1 Tax=Thalassotalea euphylliae TaxID=1655234 RepID=UPI0015F26DAA|nr:transporter substrate-binding domain-containing protein [Thalassotalea euphylliae]